MTVTTLAPDRSPLVRFSPGRTGLSPLAIPSVRTPRAASDDLAARLLRLLGALAALALPVLVVALADAVHRVEDPGTMQATAPVLPSTGAVAAERNLRGTLSRRSDAFTDLLREARR